MNRHEEHKKTKRVFNQWQCESREYHNGLKARKTIIDDDVAQLLGYLKSSRIETGLLINFGAPKLYVKKYLMTQKEG